MYDNILHKPLKLRNTVSNQGRDILSGVSAQSKYNLTGVSLGISDFGWWNL